MSHNMCFSNESANLIITMMLLTFFKPADSNEHHFNAIYWLTLYKISMIDQKVNKLQKNVFESFISDKHLSLV